MKKLFLIVALIAIFCLNGCTFFEKVNFIKPEEFSSEVIVDNGKFSGELVYNSAIDVNFEIKTPSELEGIKITQGAFGITIELDEVNIKEYRASLCGLINSPFEELFEILAVINSQDLLPDKNGIISAETEFGEFKAKCDDNKSRIINISTENHKYDFNVNQ